MPVSQVKIASFTAWQSTATTTASGRILCSAWMPTAASAPASTAITIHTIPPDGMAATIVSTHTTSAAMSAANLTTAVLPGGGHV